MLKRLLLVTMFMVGMVTADDLVVTKAGWRDWRTNDTLTGRIIGIDSTTIQMMLKGGANVAYTVRRSNVLYIVVDGKAREDSLTALEAVAAAVNSRLPPPNLRFVDEKAQEDSLAAATNASGVTPSLVQTPSSPGQRRDPAMAGLLSALVPTLGHAYAGHPGKGAGFFVAEVVEGIASGVLFEEVGNVRLSNQAHQSVVIGAVIATALLVVTRISECQNAITTADAYNAELSNGSDH